MCFVFLGQIKQCLAPKLWRTLLQISNVSYDHNLKRTKKLSVLSYFSCHTSLSFKEKNQILKSLVKDLGPDGQVMHFYDDQRPRPNF